MFDNDMDFEERLIAPELTGEDSDVEVTLRPKTLEEYIGQDKAKENLSIFIEAAKKKEMRRWIMSCYTALPEPAKRPCPKSSPTK